MKTFGRIILYLVIFILILVVAAIAYINIALPDVGNPENITIKVTPGRLARGKYLVNNVCGCINCHSTRDWSKLAGPPRTANIGGGGETFDKKDGVPGVIVSPNITPFNLKNWTDGEVLRAITTGVNKKGKPLVPAMPWPKYAQMDREDLYSIITYIRTLPAVSVDYFSSKFDFPLNLIVNTMPKKATVHNGVLPKTTDSVKYGAYLVLISDCELCHSLNNSVGEIVPGSEYGGGREFIINGNAISRAANISPDMNTGIGRWTGDDFVGKFKTYADTSKKVRVAKGDFQTYMAWFVYSGMTEGDLKSIFAYLKTMKPVNHKVVKFQEIKDTDPGAF